MQHLYLFYLFITLLTGIVSLSIVAFIYAKTRDTLVEYCLGFHLAFTLLVVSNAFVAYIDTNMPLIDFTIRHSFSYLRSWGRFVLIFTLPVFTHYLCATSRAKRKNIVWGVLVDNFFDEFSSFPLQLYPIIYCANPL